jgi:hypothetical protein
MRSSAEPAALHGWAVHSYRDAKGKQGADSQSESCHKCGQDSAMD